MFVFVKRQWIKREKIIVALHYRITNGQEEVVEEETIGAYEAPDIPGYSIEEAVLETEDMEAIGFNLMDQRYDELFGGIVDILEYQGCQFTFDRTDGYTIVRDTNKTIIYQGAMQTTFDMMCVLRLLAIHFQIPTDEDFEE